MATILIVDDEEPLRDLLSLLFEESGHRVLQAIHGRQALDIMAADQPDLVISDVMMPVMGGVELTKSLKQADDVPGHRSVPVILMSSAGKRVAEGAGADAFIDKPFDLDDMERLVKEWTEAGSAL